MILTVNNDAMSNVKSEVQIVSIERKYKGKAWWTWKMERYKSEELFEIAVADELKNRGESVQTQVYCGIGYADIITNTHIYELKIKFNAKNFFTSVGQILMYRDKIDASLVPVIVFPCYEECEKLYLLSTLANNYGISVVYFGERPYDR